MSASGELASGKNWCYQIVHICALCGEEYQKDTYAHVSGDTVTNIVGSEGVCEEHTAYCIECGYLIRHQTTSHSFTTTVSEPYNDNNVWITEACTTCGYVHRHEKQ